jgi:hypothetical protein
MMNLALRIITGLMAAVCLTGSSKMFVPKEKPAAMGGTATRWVEDFSPVLSESLAPSRSLAAAGLILPAALDIAPVLVPLAATGLGLLFADALTMRLRRGE